MTVSVLLIVITILLIALWISAMALWWHSEQGHAIPFRQDDVIRQVNKAVRMGRRTWYGTVRYGKRAATWSEKKATNALVTVFPKARAAFTEKDALTGLEHGPSSYFLAHLSRPVKKPRVRRKKSEETDLSGE